MFLHTLDTLFFLFLSSEFTVSVTTSILQLLNHFDGIHTCVCSVLTFYKLYSRQTDRQTDRQMMLYGKPS